MQRYIFADKHLNVCVTGFPDLNNAVFKIRNVYSMGKGGVYFYEIRYVSEMRQAPLQG